MSGSLKEVTETQGKNGIKMEIIRIEQLDFTYSGNTEKALENINLCIEAGEIITLCGASGSGKSTLLRNLKSVLAPFGEKKGKIFYKGELLENVDEETQVKEIGFVSQSADNQIVTDKVYHELAFGLESLGCDNETIRRRVGEMATFFGITDWFYRDVNELSGGQKQILCLASIMTMLPEVIILDEPTSQLDTIAAGEFINMLLKINRELGITIIITEHRLEEILHYSDRAIVMDNGTIIANDTPRNVCLELRNRKHKMFLSMPASVRIWNGCMNSGDKCPITINEGRIWLEEYASEYEKLSCGKAENSTDTKINSLYDINEGSGEDNEEQKVLYAKDVWFKYDKNDRDILKGVNVSISKGEIYGILGGNGAGKSTLLSVLCGIRKPYRGRVKVIGKISMLPQEPKALFVKKNVRQELDEVMGRSDKNVSKTSDKNDNDVLKGIEDVINICRLEKLLDRNPYDLSGGEQQRVALAKVLLTKPDIILLDEPTKGLDNEYKMVLGNLLKDLTKQGKTIVMVSHDIEFCGEWTDRCGLFFDGNIISQAKRRSFFSNNSFYTTATNRMARNIFSDAIVPEDIINVFRSEDVIQENSENFSDKALPPSLVDKENKNKDNARDDKSRKKEDIKDSNSNINKSSNLISKTDKRFLMAALIIVIAIPFTIYAGIHYFDDRKYLFISMLILLECITPFFVIYEGRSPSAREMVTISVICAICIAGRVAFYGLSQFKPVMAIVILSGVALGSEVGFLVGAVTMLVSNIIFGQGPWTPWQMFAMGLVGFVAGLLFYKNDKRAYGIVNKVILSLYGFISSVIIYGVIMNTSSAIMAHAALNKSMILSYYVAGLPMDLIHGVATVIFVFLLEKPMLEKLERIKIKYGVEF